MIKELFNRPKIPPKPPKKKRIGEQILEIAQKETEMTALTHTLQLLKDLYSQATDQSHKDSLMEQIVKTSELIIKKYSAISYVSLMDPTKP